jgi:PAS domain S-box-containing protein
MRRDEFRTLVAGTSDPAFVVDGGGVLVAWNEACHELFGIAAEQAIGQFCRSVVHGTDECGSFCSQHCMVQQAVRKRHPLKNFDIEVRTVRGRQWCNISVLIVAADGSTEPCAIHIARPSDVRTRLEMAMRDFIISKTGVPADQAGAMIASRSAARESGLSQRELQVLRLLAKGLTTLAVADDLHISRATVNNHVQSILHKLDSHTRRDAIRRAEHAGLI